VPFVNRAVARIVLATRAVDSAHGRFERLRSDVLAARLSDSTLDRFNDLAYEADSRYRQDGGGFWDYLFPSEEAVWRDFLPPPPARVLIGGAGAGREVAALVERGYDIVAFEPSDVLVERLAARHIERTEVYRGAYEDLPYVRRIADGQRVDLRSLAPFDAGLFGWGSFSHLRHDQHRVATLRVYGELTDGPVVVSFLRVRPGEDGQHTPAWHRLHRRLRRRDGRAPDDRFSAYLGFYHPFSRTEFEAAARGADMAVVRTALGADDRWPHAVVRRGAGTGVASVDRRPDHRMASRAAATPVSRAIARLVFATRTVDAGYRGFDQLRSDLLAALLSDATLDRVNDLAYGSNDRFRHESVRFDASLFPWEEALLREVFPPPPARVLVGGAGGGREVAALVERGHEVVAFEPSEALVESLSAWRLERTRVYQGTYEELPYVRTVPGGQRLDLRGLAPFDAGLFGWGSFSHLRHDQHRVATLRVYGELTDGPVVVSFAGLRAEGDRRSGVHHLLPRREGREPGDRFSPLMGFYHPTDRLEFEAIARRAGMDVERAVFETRDISVWPHVVVRRLDRSGRREQRRATS
jgi:hypothetical protein